VVIYEIVLYLVIMDIQWMAFHRFCSLHNALWWKCVCL